MEKVIVNKDVIIDLVKLTNEINDRLESLELASNSEIMESLRKSKEQIKKGELVEFDDL